MSRLAVIGTFYQRHERTEALVRRVCESPDVDEFWLMCEGEDDLELAFRAADGCFYDYEGAFDIHLLPTPRAENGQYAVIPYSHKINFALDRTQADYITYVTNDSMPHPDKYRLMAQALDEHPEWGAVYCSQDFGKANDSADWLAGGTHEGIRRADRPEPAPFCQVDHTQVMHRRTEDRWPLDLAHMQVGDGVFFRDLVARVGPLQPIPDVLDWTRQLPDGISAAQR